MSKQTINIEHLEIRLRGISPESARSAVNGLGETLLSELSPASRSSEQQATRISSINPGTIQLATGTTANELRDAIAGRVAASIKAKLK